MLRARCTFSYCALARTSFTRVFTPGIERIARKMGADRTKLTSVPEWDRTGEWKIFGTGRIYPEFALSAGRRSFGGQDGSRILLPWQSVRNLGRGIKGTVLHIFIAAWVCDNCKPEEGGHGRQNNLFGCPYPATLQNTLQLGIRGKKWVNAQAASRVKTVDGQNDQCPNFCSP